MMKINTDRSPRELRLFALGWIVLIGVVGAMIWRHSGSTDYSVLVWTGGGAIGVAGLVAPAVIRPVYLALAYGTFPIGWTVLHFLMAVVYFIIVSPTGLLLRLTGRDPLQLKRDRSVESFWLDRKVPTDKGRYFRQF